MKPFPSGEPDYAFGQVILTLRTATGLTQAGLAKQLGVSRRAVGAWEVGSSYPKAEHLKELIVLGMQHHAFPVERAEEEIRALWQASHQKMCLDEHWLTMLLGQWYPLSPLAQSEGLEEVYPGAPTSMHPASGPLLDWEDALAVPMFYGREQEMAQVSQWVLEQHCQVVSLLGMGGIGKSALAVELMHHLAHHFDAVIFRSLRDAPCCEALLDDCLQVLAPQSLRIEPGSLQQRIRLLLEQLRTSRILLVLDNLESLLKEGDVQGQLRPGFEGYESLLRHLGQSAHHSCVLLTSREKPAQLRPLEGKHAPVRSLRLSGLDATACEHLLADNEVVGSLQQQIRLVEAYAGNPLALKIVIETITDLFGGDIGQFLTGESIIFGSIADLLKEQFARLSSLEQTVLYWLAIVREPITLDQLLAVLVVPVPHMQILEALDGLRRRSLIERGQHQGSFTLQSVVLEYVSTVLIEESSREIEHHQLKLLIEHGLEQASACDYVRQTQQRLLLASILTILQSLYQGRGEVEAHLLSLLDQLRERADTAQGYGPANLVALLRLQQGHLHSVDLSHLVIRGAYLQGTQMQDAKLCGALIRETVFTEALDAIWSIAISSSGKFWAAGTWRGEVRIWSKGGQRLHLAWQAHTDNAFTLAFSPDERLLATGGWDGAVKLWEVHTGALLWTGWHTDHILSVAFAPDGYTLASGGNDAKIRFWDILTGQHVQTLASQDGAVYSMTWSSDGSLLAGGCLDGSIRMWRMQGSQPSSCAQTLVGHTNWVHSLAFAPEGTRLASASWDSTVKLWDATSGQVCQTLTGHTQRVYSVAWSPDGRIVASAGQDKTVWLWDVTQNRYKAALHGHTAIVHDLAFTPDSSNLVSGSEDGTLRVWNVTGGQLIRTIEGYAVCSYDLAWSPDGQWLASADSDSLVTLWEVTDENSYRGLRGHNWLVLAVAWSPDGQWLASGGWDNAIRLWKPTTGACLQVLRDPDTPDTLFHCVAWSPDERLLASGTYMQGMQMWEMGTRTRCWIEKTHQTTLRCIAWNPEGTRIASGGDDGYVYMWNAVDGALQLVLPGHHGIVASVAWGPDGTLLASAGGGRDSGEVFVWNMQSGERVRDLVGHLGVVWAVTWDLRNDQLISGDSDGILRWWHAQSGQCVHVQAAHQGAIRSLKISPEGHKLASCGTDGTIKLWDLHSAKLLRTLRRDRPYERLTITGVRGLTEAQKATLRALGAIEDAPVNVCTQRTS